MASVSPTTVSRYLNGKIELPDETEEKIQNAVEELNYSANLVAKSLVSKKSRTIALIVPDISNPFFAEISKGAQLTAEDEGYSVLLCDSNEMLDNEKRYMEKLSARFVDGYIFAGLPQKHTNISFENPNEHISDYVSNKPVLFVNRKSDMDFPEITHDSFKAAQLLAEHLIELNYKDLILITGRENIPGSQEAINGFVSKINEYSHKIKYSIYKTNLKIKGGMRVGEKILDDNSKNLGIITFNELTAAGLVIKSKERNLSIPEDFSLVTINNSFLSSVIHPFLTCAKFDSKHTGRLAIEKLIDLINKDDEYGSPTEKQMLKPQLITKDSSKQIN